MKRNLLIVGVALALCAGLLVLRNALYETPLSKLRAEDGGYKGSWYFPRGGPYIIGFESPSDAVVLINKRPVVSGAGEQKARVVYEAGVAEVEVRGPAGLRLLWHPPGRRGALEYVPASSLSPESPESARFGPGAGASWGDAAVATAILFLLALAGILVARPKIERDVLLAVGGVFALAVLVRVLGLDAQGQTWDEDEYWSSGRNYLVNLLSGDFSLASWRWNYEHPPVTKYIAGLGALWHDGYTVSRLLFSLLGAGTCALAVAIGRRLFDLRVGILAGVIAALMPRLLAHDKVVGHEAPSVFFWTLAVYLALRACDADGTARMVRRFVWVGVALGLAASTRFANLLVGPVLAVAVVLYAGRERWIKTNLVAAVAGPLAAAITFIAVWPRMWVQPWQHLQAAWKVLKEQNLPEFYLGQEVTKPEWHYFPLYALVTTPVVILLASLGLAAWRAASRREKAMVVLLVWLLLPFGVQWSPVRQDGVRYILPMFVPLSLLASAGLVHLCDRYRDPRAFRATAVAVALYLVVTCFRVHPYYLDYYAEHVGGPATVAERRLFEVGWWGEGLNEAVEYINAHAAPSATVNRSIQPIHTSWFRADLWRPAGLTSADWVLVNDPGIIAHRLIYGVPFELPADLTLAHTVTAQGAPLVQIYRR